MHSIKFLLLVVFAIVGWWAVGEVLEQLRRPGNVQSITERLGNLPRRVHAAVGTVAIVILLFLLVRLMVQAARGN
jgi:hypothetical protein